VSDSRPPAPIARRFEARVAESPDATAIRYRERSYSYGEVNRLADQLAARLRGAPLSEGIIALGLARGPGLIIAMVAVLKADRSYLPLDLASPLDRNALYVRDSGCVLALVDGPEGSSVAERASVPALNVDLVELASGTMPVASAPSQVADHSPAYVIYTSGSTGTPKGCVVSQFNVARLFDAAVSRVGFERSDVWTWFHSQAFDFSVWEIWGALTTGARLVIVPGDVLRDPRELWDLLIRERVTLLSQTPSAFRALTHVVMERAQNHPSDCRLRLVVLGGEPLDARTLSPWIRSPGPAAPTFINGYGPTETTVFATFHVVTEDEILRGAPSNIGIPLGDLHIRIVDPAGNLVANGDSGEILIGGGGVSLGYLGRDQLTADRFVSLADTRGGVRRYYRSGDLGRWLPGDEIEYLGRMDRQVKIRGYRIELGEIEANIRAFEGVTDTAVVARPDAAGTHRLVAYLVASDSWSGVPVLRDALVAALPGYMVPASFVQIERLPLTLNGKLDESALPPPPTQRPDLQAAFVAPRGALELAIAEEFQRQLQIEAVGAEDDFFALGGSSLEVIEVCKRLTAETGHAVTPPDLYAARSPQALAARLGGDAARGDAPDLPRSPGGLNSPIAIIAVAGRFPGADSVERFWKNLVDGRDSISHFAREDLDPSLSRSLIDDPAYVRARGVLAEVELFDPSRFGMSQREAELTDPQIRIGLELCDELLERGGYGRECTSTKAGRIGVFGGMWRSTYLRHHLEPNPDLARVGDFNLYLANDPEFFATRIAHRLGLQGPAVTLNTACSTSLVAVATAVDNLRLGRCELAIAGGVAVTCPPRSGYLYNEGSMLSPDGCTRPFDADAAGTVFSDGAAFVLLKPLDRAQRDGDPIIAVIRGVAVNNDGADKASFTAPSVAGQAAVIAAALQDACVGAESVQYVEAHGTATPLGDPIEVTALQEAFAGSGRRERPCGLGSVKGNVGHTVMAAGATGLIKVALALQRELLPASLNYAAPNPHIDFASGLFEVVSALRPWRREGEPRRAAVSSFGVGGTNAHVVLEEPPHDSRSVAREPMADPRWHALPVSAGSSDLLTAYAHSLADAVVADGAATLADVAFTLQNRRPASDQRVVIVANDRGAGIEALRGHGRPVPCGAARKIVFAFPGQGAQRLRMGLALAEFDADSRQWFDRAEACLGTMDVRLREVLAGADETTLRQTRLAQPALFVVELAVARFLQARGLHPDVCIGHSVGEFVAAVVAGVMSDEDALRLVAHRGQLMQRELPGSMLSVRCAASDLLSRLPVELELAVDNGPDACVVAGPTEAVEAFAVQIENAGLACRRLPTSHAFHTRMMDGAAAAFGRVVAAVSLQRPNIPIVSTQTGRRLSDDEAVSPEYWARQLRQPVLFRQAVELTLREGPSLWLEAGPGTALTSLIRSSIRALKGDPDVHLASPTLGGDPANEEKGLLEALGVAWCAGKTVRLDSVGTTGAARAVMLPAAPRVRIRCWVDAPRAGAAPTAMEPAVAPTTVPGQGAAATVSSAVPGVAAASVKDVNPASGAPAVRVPSPAARVSDGLRRLFDQVAGVEIRAQDDGSTFVDLGLDSLALTQVALEIQREFAVKVTFRDLMRTYPTLEQLAAVVAERGVVPAQSEDPPQASLDDASTSISLDGAGALAPILQQMMARLDQIERAVGGNVPADARGAKSPRLPASPSGVVNSGARGEDDAAHTRYDVKKAFGAIARIHRESEALSARQQSRLDAFVRRYTARTAQSKAFTDANRLRLADPRVVNGFRPTTKEIVYQLVVGRSQGSRIWDIDGNEYIDVLNGFGMNLFGWQPDFIREALHRQVDAGFEIGPQHPLAAEVADLVCELTGFDRAALCNTGSEAVLGALRVARTVTGRSLIVSFAGSYHGIFDEVLVRGTRTLRTVPAAPGVLSNSLQNVLVLDYGTPESLEIIRSRAHEIAAVLAEPVQSRRPDFRPTDFLKQVREITRDSGAVFILDEVITGFRSHPRGVRGLYDLDCDLAAYGKVVGGGLPIGVIAGKRAFMDALDGGGWRFGDDSAPSVGVTYFAGTFVRHPLALAAAKASLEHLRERGPSLQEGLNSATARMTAEMNDFCKASGAPIDVRAFSSLWRVTFLEDHPYQDLLAPMMRSRGIHILEGFPCFLTTAHSEADIQAIVEAFKASVRELQESGFLPGTIDRPSKPSDTAGQPPVEGARLARGKDGKLAWWVPDPSSPTKFRQVS
jgi:amino acid adenylation domain-containing protein